MKKVFYAIGAILAGCYLLGIHSYRQQTMTKKKEDDYLVSGTGAGGKIDETDNVDFTEIDDTNYLTSDDLTINKLQGVADVNPNSVILY